MDDIRIETERLILREWEPSDLEAVHEYASNPENVKYLIWGPNTEEQTRAHRAETAAWRREEPRVRFELVITRRGDDRAIGGCGLAMDPGVPEEAEMGYLLNKRYWGRGYGPEAAAALVAWGRRELGLDAVRATCNSENSASIRLMEKIGMERTAYWSKHILLRSGKWRDTVVYRIGWKTPG